MRLLRISEIQLNSLRDGINNYVSQTKYNLQ